jgi:hypothetical protein
MEPQATHRCLLVAMPEAGDCKIYLAREQYSKVIYVAKTQITGILTTNIQFKTNSQSDHPSVSINHFLIHRLGLINSMNIPVSL